MECNKKVYKKGIAFLMVHSLSVEFYENWCNILREKTGNPLIDWSFYGGRAIFLVIGDPDFTIKEGEKLAYLIEQEYKLEYPDSIYPGQNYKFGIIERG